MLFLLTAYFSLVSSCKEIIASNFAMARLSINKKTNPSIRMKPNV